MYHPQKHKLRVVFDCAATYQGESLNSQLLQGPNFNNYLIGVLMRFRHKPIALAADVEGMFHQVRLPAKYKDLFRFFWWPKGETAQEMEEYRMTVHFLVPHPPQVVQSMLCKAAQKTTVHSTDHR